MPNSLRMTNVEAIKILEKEKNYMDNHGGDSQSEALEIAIKSLEKQIPKEVSTMEYRNDYDWTCNNCDTTFKYIRYTVDKPSYCPNCGQALKWE